METKPGTFYARSDHLGGRAWAPNVPVCQGIASIKGRYLLHTFLPCLGNVGSMDESRLLSRMDGVNL